MYTWGGNDTPSAAYAAKCQQEEDDTDLKNSYTAGFQISEVKVQLLWDVCLINNSVPCTSRLPCESLCYSWQDTVSVLFLRYDAGGHGSSAVEPHGGSHHLRHVWINGLKFLFLRLASWCSSIHIVFITFTYMIGMMLLALLKCLATL